MIITLKNFYKVPISDLIESVVYDIDNFVNAGFDINMSSFAKKGENNNCAVCLGGAAVFGFNSPEKLKPFISDEVCELDYLIYRQYNNENYIHELRNMACMFDNIRIGSKEGSLYFLRKFSNCEISSSTWISLFTKTLPTVYDSRKALSNDEIMTMKVQLLDFSNELRKKGY